METFQYETAAIASSRHGPMCDIGGPVVRTHTQYCRSNASVKMHCRFLKALATFYLKNCFNISMFKKEKKSHVILSNVQNCFNILKRFVNILRAMPGV